MDVEMLKGARTQKVLDYILVSCMVALLCLYILCFLRPQSVTHCVLAFLIRAVSDTPETRPRSAPVGPFWRVRHRGGVGSHCHHPRAV